MSHPSTKIRIRFASNGTRAVILREGPAKWTRMLCWDTRDDTIVPGQWIRSSIPYFDVNSDATLILAFVQSYRRKPDYGTWVALSRPPWFTASAVWQIGDSWGGHCRFISDHHVYIEAGLRPVTLSQGALGRRMRWSSDPAFQDRRVWSLQHGWTAETLDGVACLVKRCKYAGIEVRCGREPVDSCMVLYRIDGKRRIRLAEFETVYFGEFDASGRFVFSRRDGRVHRASLRRNALIVEEVCDLSAMRPEAIKAPEDVGHW
ncbi:MAG: hypothetical protein ABI411_04105 [Tahibacter sp.]